MATRALVLGGGGPVGIAWEAGLIAGLAEAGIDLSRADLIVGTSAGSYVGALLAGGRAAADLAAPYLGKAPMPPSASQLLKAPPDLTPLIGKIMESYAGERPQAEVCAEIGKWAIEAAPISEEAFVSTYDTSMAALAADVWPEKFACTAVDTANGAFTVWNKASGVPLRRAVASSCAVPGVYAPVAINGRRYMDGGMRSGTCADLAKGYDSVVLIMVTSGAVMPDVFRRPLERELRILRESGSRVEMVIPGAESVEAFGPNLMDPSRRPAAAAAGLKQGQAGSAALAAFWN